MSRLERVVVTLAADMASHPVCLAELSDGDLCMGVANVRLQIGCVHEHVGVQQVCERCAEDALNGTATCRACEYGPDPHVCKLIGREVPDEPEHQP